MLGAGPVLGLFAALGIGSAASFALFGTFGLIAAAVVAVVLASRPRRQNPRCAPVDDTVTVMLDTPAMRTSR